MESENNDPLTLIFALLKYKELAQNLANHPEIVKDKTTVNFLAYVLDSSDEEVLKTSLDTLELLSESNCGRSTILGAFGVTESLRSLASRPDVSVQIKESAEKLLEKLKSADPSVKHVTKVIPSKKKKVLTMHIHGLHSETQKDLEDILTKKMKGVHSVIVDVEHQKCTVIVYEQIDPKNVALVIYENTEMEAQLITKNKFNQEILVPLLECDKESKIEDLPPYLDEQDSPVKEKAVRSAKDFRITASEWFCTAAGFLQRTLYW